MNCKAELTEEEREQAETFDWFCAIEDWQRKE